MNAPRNIRPLVELLNFFTGWVVRCKKERRHGEQLGVETAQDILTDVVAEQNEMRDMAHKAEVADREALRLLDAAVLPDSDGGRFITPKEMAKIRRYVSRSAELDHDISEKATVAP